MVPPGPRVPLLRPRSRGAPLGSSPRLQLSGGAMAEVAGPGAEIGRILVQVQEDLQQLKDKLRDISHDREPVDVQSLEAAIERTESGFRKQTEKYLNAVNRTVLTISPTYNVDLCSRQMSKWGIPMETSQKEITFPGMPGIATQHGGSSPPHQSSASKQKLSMMVKIMYNPRNTCHRNFVNLNYGVDLPLINQRKTVPAAAQKVAKGVTVGNLSVAPPSLQLNNISLPVTERDAERGILNLIERGLIPRAARITLEKPPVVLKAVPLHEFHTKHKKPAADEGVESKKEEVCHPPPPPPPPKPIRTPNYTSKGNRRSKGSIAPPPSCISVISPRKSKLHLIQALQKWEFATSSALLLKTSEVTPSQAFQNLCLEFEIPVRKGAVDYTARDLQGFKKYCCLFWGSVLSFLEHVANFLKDYAIPSAIIKGKKVLEIIPDFELNQRLTREEILSVIKNVSVVRKLLSQPGQRYKGQNGIDMAATKIQATWRCYKSRKAYIVFRQQQWASGVIAISWLVHVHMGRVKKTLKESRQRHLENFYIRAKHLAANWNRIRTSRRTIIHIPSLGYMQSVREATPDFTILQGSQFGRLCEIQGSTPEVAHLYSSKSGSKRIFAAASVPVPPGQYDIYSRQQMVEVLSQLIIDHPEVKRWVFKVDSEFEGNGTAFCDISTHLKCYPWLLKESRRYGPETWKTRWAHEPALAKISQELPGLLAQHAQAVNEKRFPTWGKFLQTFVSQGGIIEAFPPSDSITNLTVDMLIEPAGEITVVSSGDQFHADSPLRSSGTTLPQCSVEPWVLNLLCLQIGEACKSRGVIGYFSIDFVTFIHPQTMGQQLWAIDLDLHYSDHLALTQVLLYVTNGTLDCRLSRFEVQLIPSKPVGRHSQKEEPQTPSVVNRYVVMSNSIMHGNFSLIYYNVFLQMCKAHGIGYDVQQREGTVFTLFEDQKRLKFGMLTIGEHLQGVLMTFAQQLFIIYQELSAPNMHAETNFKGAVEDIERILGVTEQNKLKFEEEKEASKARTSTK
ncbi:IQ domain-containing protein H isoform X2 [Rhineura floridana]|uniref:IQ domain-containing protein H isoform X2 n=1 Tax=Rhineura floridana TaxID=261503 RepID=UPI002AC7EF7B|nr:IQ domain-containing protein H isoform X2 [Rhineura floridana]